MGRWFPAEWHHSEQSPEPRPPTPAPWSGRQAEKGPPHTHSAEPPAHTVRAVPPVTAGGGAGVWEGSGICWLFFNAPQLKNHDALHQRVYVFPTASHTLSEYKPPSTFTLSKHLSFIP